MYVGAVPCSLSWSGWLNEEAMVNRRESLAHGQGPRIFSFYLDGRFSLSWLGVEARERLFALIDGQGAVDYAKCVLSSSSATGK